MNRTPNWAEPRANAERAELVWDREPVLFRTASKSPSPSLWIPSRVAGRRLAADGDLGRRCACSAPRSSESLTRTRCASLRARFFEFADSEGTEEILGRSATSSPRSHDGGSRRGRSPKNCLVRLRRREADKSMPQTRTTPTRRQHTISTRSRPSRNAESESLEINPLRYPCAYLTSEAIELLDEVR